MLQIATLEPTRTVRPVVYCRLTAGDWSVQCLNERTGAETLMETPAGSYMGKGVLALKLRAPTTY